MKNKKHPGTLEALVVLGSVLALGAVVEMSRDKSLSKNNSPYTGYVEPLNDPVSEIEPIKQNVEREAITQKEFLEPKIERTNYKTSDFSEDSDVVLLARAGYGEARELCYPLIHKNNPSQEEIEFAEKGLGAVMYIPINRRDHPRINWGDSVREIILDPSYSRCYDSFMEGNPTRPALMDPQSDDPEAWGLCLNIAERVISGDLKDPTNGATHFFSGNDFPYWVEDMEPKGSFGNQKFYREN